MEQGMIDAATRQWHDRIVHSLAFMFNLLSQGPTCDMFCKKK
jgi:hypothetical protein